MPFLWKIFPFSEFMAIFSRKQAFFNKREEFFKNAGYRSQKKICTPKKWLYLAKNSFTIFLHLPFLGKKCPFTSNWAKGCSPPCSGSSKYYHETRFEILAIFQQKIELVFANQNKISELKFQKKPDFHHDFTCYSNYVNNFTKKWECKTVFLQVYGSKSAFLKMVISCKVNSLDII